MDAPLEDFLLYGVIVFIISMIIISGPAIPVVELTQKTTGTQGPGAGSVNITIESTPTERIQITKGDYSTKTYYLQIPTASIQVHDVIGNPIVVYNLQIPDLGFGVANSYVLSEEDLGPLSLTMKNEELARSKISKSRYEGILEIYIRTNGENDAIYKQKITIMVKDK